MLLRRSAELSGAGRAAGLLLLALLGAAPAQAAGPSCTIIVEADTGATISRDGPCDARNSPASTFKIPLALMGYDAAILTDPHTPAWPYRDEYHYWSEAGRKAVDPTSWLSDSIVWYSQLLVRHLGAERFQGYVNRFDYGNRDLSGDADHDGGLPPAVWVSSSLQISPVEEVAFLRKLLHGELPVSRQARDMTMAIVPTFPLAGSWIVHGKTGTGYQPGAGRTIDHDRQFGWFVGWARKGAQTVVFARLIKDDAKAETYAGPRTRDAFLADFPSLMAPK